MHNKFCSFFICCLIYFLSGSLQAKEFKLISLDDFGPIKEIKFQDESTPQILNITKFYPNINFPIPNNNLIHFYALNPDTRASSKKPILRLSFSDVRKNIIVFLMLNKDKPNLIDYEYLINEEDSFPLSSTLILNLSNKPIAGKIGDNIFSLSPKSRKLIRLQTNESGTFSDKVFFAEQREDLSINYFYSSDWRVPKGKKSLCFIDYDEETNSHVLVDILL